MNLPVSKKITDRIGLNGNVGATFFPHVKAPAND